MPVLGSVQVTEVTVSILLCFERPVQADSEPHADAELGRKGNADRRAGPEEVAERAGWYLQLVQARDRHGLRATRVEAERRRVGQAVHRRWQRGDVGHVVRAWIVAIEHVEELNEGRERPAVKVDGPADPEIDLNVRSAAELIEGRLHAVDDRPIVRW